MRYDSLWTATTKIRFCWCMLLCASSNMLTWHDKISVITIPCLVTERPYQSSLSWAMRCGRAKGNQNENNSRSLHWGTLGRFIPHSRSATVHPEEPTSARLSSLGNLHTVLGSEQWAPPRPIRVLSATIREASGWAWASNKSDICPPIWGVGLRWRIWDGRRYINLEKRRI